MKRRTPRRAARSSVKPAASPGFRPWPEWLCHTCTRPRTTRFSWRWSAAAGAAPAPPSNALSDQERPHQAGGHGRCLPAEAERQPRHLQRPFASTRWTCRMDRQFIGFDAYRKAMDCLKPGDVAIFATPPAFRWVHFTYAIEKGLNVFMEKPVTVDGPTTRRMLKLGEEAGAQEPQGGRGLDVPALPGAAGTAQAHPRRRRSATSSPCAATAWGRGGDVAWPKARRHQRAAATRSSVSTRFLWASGGCFSDFYIHQIDECSWMKGAWPVEAMALGGRHYRGDAVDQNFDIYSVEYTYPDGTQAVLRRPQHGRACHNEFASYVHGSKGSAVISTNAHTPGRRASTRARTFRAGMTARRIRRRRTWSGRSRSRRRSPTTGSGTT